MSGASINKKVAKGLAKAGKVLGWKFNVYRPDSYLTPFSDENRLFSTQASWSEDKGFSKNPEATLTHYNIYADHRKLQPGDIMNSPDLDRTFVITETNELRGAVAVQANGRMTVRRVIYTPTEDIKTQSQEVATEVPCAVEFKTNYGEQGVLTGTGSAATGHRSQVEIWTWMPVGSLRLNDTLELSIGTFTLTSVQQDEGGTTIQARSTKVGV